MRVGFNLRIDIDNEFPQKDKHAGRVRKTNRNPINFPSPPLSRALIITRNPAHTPIVDTRKQRETYNVLILNKHSPSFRAPPLKRPPTCAKGELALNIFRIVTGRRLLAENVRRTVHFLFRSTSLGTFSTCHGINTYVYV